MEPKQTLEFIKASRSRLAWAWQAYVRLLCFCKNGAYLWFCSRGFIVVFERVKNKLSLIKLVTFYISAYEKRAVSDNEPYL